jgi:DNA polymerase-3 subunit epsilon
MTFVAIDFETADYGADSACQIALVKVRDGVIVDRASHLIKPPRRQFVFTGLHGIEWDDVESAPTFGELWPMLEPMLDGVAFLAAHNASFDRGVLASCCRAARLKMPKIPFKCTVQLSRHLWGIKPTKLSNVCRHFHIPLNHHEASSDAEACAQIMIRALEAQVSRSRK